ncbi:MAG: hypothetical protein BWY36_00130 [Candidatus Diapherotrites archaeon ADurb.Bin253]|nr:MAG: hypothetical protein BWY36_00130 [Candidatus Diapherotrites archaeon ADurb.Bin253]
MEQENALQIWFVVCSQNYNKPKIKMKKEKQKKETKVIAILQIFILVIATIAFSWIVGSSIETVSASDGSKCRQEKGGNCIASTQTCDGERIVKTTLCPTGYQCCVPKKDKGGDGGGSNLLDTSTKAVALASQGVTTVAGIQQIKNNKEVIELMKAGLSPKVPPVSSPTSQVSGLMPLDPKFEAELAKAMAENDAFLDTIKPIREGFFKDWTIMGTGDSTGIGAMAGDFVAAVGWAAVAFAVVWGITELMGASKRNQADILTAAGVGGVIGIVLVTVNLLAVPWAAGFVLGAALLWGVLSYQNYAQEVYTYRVKLWQPPSGGAECSKCNLLKVGTGKNQVSGCSEYICRSYGASCEWINDESQYETCIEVNKGDISPPVITPAREINGEPVFKDNKFRYDISAAGARIVYEGEGGGAAGCIPTYTPIKLAFTTNEEAHCKISLEPKAGTAAEAFDAMNDYLNEQNLKTKNHTLQIPSSVFADEKSFENAGYILNNGGKYNFYVRCKDQRGNINTQDYEIRICVQKGLNTNPPKIVGTNPAKDSFIPFNVSVIENFQVYTDRPADCKWDIKEASYNYMSYDFDKCSQNINEYLVGFDYGCQTNLTGFKDGVENKYYVACKNYPEFKGNPEKESKRTPSRPYEIVLKGTNKLVIQSVRINDRANGTTIIGREENAKIELSVVTIGGAEEGKSRCLYSENQVTPTYSLFSNGRSREYLNTNFEEFYMPQGFYEYLIKCYDSAENTATTLINFTVEVDLLSPMVVRAFKDDSSNSLKIITDESARCVYSTTSCNYNIEEGNELSTENGKEHYIEWNPEIDLYVKCIDDYHNYPNEGECSIVVRPFEMMGVF